MVAGVMAVSSINACHRAKNAPGPESGSATGTEGSRAGLALRLEGLLDGPRLLGRLRLWKRWLWDLCFKTGLSEMGELTTEERRTAEAE